MPGEAILRRLYGPAQPTTAAGGETLYTVPAATRTTVKQVILCNVTGSSADVQVALPGADVDPESRIVDITVAAKTTFTLDLTLPMEATELLRGVQGTVGAITVTVSGVEESL